jgi:pantoate--beta-alanine ligase
LVGHRDRWPSASLPFQNRDTFALFLSYSFVLKKNNEDHNDILIKKKELQKKFNIKIDYLEVRNEKNLTSLIKNKKIRLFVAYYINKVRLIDNF